MGVSRSSCVKWVSLTLHSITKLMGESFKLHAQALVGYEDAVASRSSSGTPTMSSQGVQELDIETTF